MIAMLWTGIALKFKDQSAGNYRDAVQNNQNLALLFEENVLRSVGEVDNALLYLRHQIEQQRDSVDLHTILMNTKLISEVIDQFAIIDAKRHPARVQSQGRAAAADQSQRPRARPLPSAGLRGHAVCRRVR